MIEAKCSACGAESRIADAASPGTCPACGGALEAVRPADERALPPKTSTGPAARPRSLPPRGAGSGRARLATGKKTFPWIPIGIGAVVVLVVAVLGVVMGSGDDPQDAGGPPAVYGPPETPEEAVSAFERIWAHPELEGIEDIFKQSMRDRAPGLVRNSLYRHDWSEPRPQIEGHRVGTRDARGRLPITFETTQGEVKTNWVRENGHLALRHVILPDLVGPDPAPALERFKNAFAAGDFETMGTFFAEVQRPEELQDLRNKFDRLGWAAATPTVVDWTATKTRDTRAELELELEEGVARAIFVWEAGSWTLKSFREPE